MRTLSAALLWLPLVLSPVVVEAGGNFSAPLVEGLIDSINVGGQAGSCGNASGQSGATGTVPAVYAVGVLPDERIIFSSQTQQIHMVEANDTVHVVAGAYGMSGSADGYGLGANAPRFALLQPHFIWYPTQSKMYFCDNHAVRSIQPNPPYQVTTVVGSSTSGSTDNVAPLSAKLSSCYGIAFSVYGNPKMYIVETGGQRIREYDFTGNVVSTVAGSYNVAGYVDDVGSAARFNGPKGLSRLGFENSYVLADNGNNVIRLFNAHLNVVSTYACSGGASGLSHQGEAFDIVCVAPVAVAVLSDSRYLTNIVYFTNQPGSGPRLLRRISYNMVFIVAVLSYTVTHAMVSTFPTINAPGFPHYLLVASQSECVIHKYTPVWQSSTTIWYHAVSVSKQRLRAKSGSRHRKRAVLAAMS